MVLTRDQIQVAQGVLYLIDHIGRPPPDMNFRQFTDQAIKDHLKQHTYHHKPNRNRVTLVWMRRHMRDLFRKATASFYESGSSTTMDDRTDKLFRKGTTEGFPDHVLKNYIYDRATFSEADLPGYERRAELVDGDEDAVEEDEITQANNTQPEYRKRVRDSSGHFVSSKQLRTGAAHIASPSRSSQKSFRTSADEESEKDEDDDDDDRYSSFSDAKETLGIQNDQAELYLQAQASADLSTRAEPTTSTSEEEESAPRFQSQEKRGGGLPKTQAAYPAATPTTATESAPIPLPSATQDSNAPPALSHLMDSFDNFISQIKRQSSSDPEQTELKQPSVRASVESSKRKRGDEDLDDAIEDEEAIKPTQRKKSKTSIKIGPNVRHPQVVIPGATSPPRASSQPTLDTSTTQEADIMQGVEHASDVRPVEVETEITNSQFAQPAASSQDAEEQQLQPAPFDIEQQGRDFGRFYRTLEVATDRLIDSIGSINDFLSPMDESPSERLEALYKRCWGSIGEQYECDSRAITFSPRTTSPCL